MTTSTRLASLTEIPEISDSQVFALYSRIKPVVRDRNTRALVYIQDVNPLDVPFTLNPSQIGLADDLRRMGRTTMAFKGEEPTIKEVLAQIPKNMLRSVSAFEVLPDNASIPGSQLHVSRVVLYKKATQREQLLRS